MRCSWCEASLDEFVEATLSPAAMQAVAAHLRECAACEALHRRLRIVDALLETARIPELEPAFTDAVMVRVRMLPVPAPARRAIWPIAACYVIAAWIATAIAIALSHSGAPAAAAQAIAARTGSALAGFMGGLHALWPVAPLAASLVIGVLSVDVVLFAVVIVFYRTVRPRLAARLAAVKVA